ncbi:hypothetical protein [Streptomyces sp. CO7]
MGGKPSAAARAAATRPTASGTGVDIADTMATAPVPALSDPAGMSGRFGMPHALVVIACIATAAILAPPGMGVHDILLLIAGAGGIGAGIVVMAGTGGRGAGRMGRLVRAYFSSGS